MECMEARALKSSYPTEIAMKNVILEDIWCIKGLPGDDFSIDEFFDIPNEEIINNNKEGGSFLEEDDEEEEEEKYSSSSGFLSSSHDPVDDSAHFSTHLGDLAIPDDDMQELELWSHFMDDSVPEPILACPKPIMDTQIAHTKKTGLTLVNRVEPYAKQSIVRPSYCPMAVPVKPRSKRSRSIGYRSWLTGSSPKTKSSLLSLSPPLPLSTLLFAPPAHEFGMFFTYGKQPLLKKPKKKTTLWMNCETGLSNPVHRRCTHCQVTKTPQWRAGPNGPKTLCNACGVRFKSGRLFPEYRPACSPTFSSQVHSNSHRRVIEMRRKKEIAVPLTGSAQLIS